MKNLSNSKLEHIKNLVDEQGHYLIMAIDHRMVYTNLMLEISGKEATTQDVINSKIALIKEFKNTASGYLIDPQYSVPALIDSKEMGTKGYMIGIEGDDYSTTTFKDDYLNPDITVQKIKDCGGSMVKLFVFYNPNSAIAAKQEIMIEQVAKECNEAQLPFLLEPIMYFDEKPTQQTRTDVFRQMLKRLSKYDVDVFKLEFPGDVEMLCDEENTKACLIAKEELSVPWILLSSGASREVFLKQLKHAMLGGASGFAIGRSLWGECVCGEEISGEQKWTNMINFFENAKKVVKDNSK